MTTPIPTAAAHLEAKKCPGGNVYVISPIYEGKEEIPPEGIIGAWKVDDNGNLTDTFTFNPNYKPDQETPKKKPWWRF